MERRLEKALRQAETEKDAAVANARAEERVRHAPAPDSAAEPAISPEAAATDPSAPHHSG